MIPDYKRIYKDMIHKNYPKIMPLCMRYLSKRELTTLDIIELNSIISQQDKLENAKLKVYDKASILKILDYQKKNKLSNTQAANYFKVSRNSIANWKKDSRFNH
ncbi:transposase [Chryseobacterium sp. CH21]|nr:transposase [Chryseobacterium sp. CH21]